MLSWTVKIGIKAATLGIIKESDIDALSEIGEDVASDTSETISDLVKERLSAHGKETQLMQSFRESLSDLPANLLNNDSGRLVIVIDELDRCKPTFAVEILEKIKHLFSVKNVVFLLVMHKQQLEEAVRNVYGRNIDAHTYLQKFINVETFVPGRADGRYESDIGLYIERLCYLHKIETWGDSLKIRENLIQLAQYFNLSLRQLEKVFTNLVIIYSTLAPNQLRLVSIIVFIAVVKVINPALFRDLLLGSVSYQDCCKRINFRMVDEGGDEKIYHLMHWIRFSLLTDSEYREVDLDDPVRMIERSLWQYGIDRKGILRFFCQGLSMFVVN